MAVSIVYKPRPLLKKMRAWLTTQDTFGTAMYQRIQDAEVMGAERVIINGDEADYLLRKFLD